MNLGRTSPTLEMDSYFCSQRYQTSYTPYLYQKKNNIASSKLSRDHAQRGRWWDKGRERDFAVLLLHSFLPFYFLNFATIRSLEQSMKNDTSVMQILADSVPFLCVCVIKAVLLYLWDCSCIFVPDQLITPPVTIHEIFWFKILKHRARWFYRYS